MAIERIEWQCPQCERRYAVPANLPRPTVCPKCQPDDAQPAATEQSVTTLPGGSGPTAPLRDAVEFETPPGKQTSGADRYRRKYPALRVISLFYRCMAAVIVLATVVAFVSGVVAVFQAEDQSARWVAVGIGLGSLVGGALWSVTVLAFAELIKLMIDIEQNTRQR